MAVVGRERWVSCYAAMAGKPGSHKGKEGDSGITTQVRWDRQAFERISPFALARAVLAVLVDIGQHLHRGQVLAG